MRLGWLLAVAVACNGDGGKDHGGDGADADTDADADSDADTDVPTGVDADGDGFPEGVDCDDADGAVYPGAPDLCGDGRVTDCDRTSDDGLVNVDGAVGYGSLQDALDAASPGSELVLCPGTYVGTFVAAVPVDLVALEDATTTILSGPGGTTLAVVGGTSITGLTIRDGTDGGLHLLDAGTLDLDGVVLTHNKARDGAGLVVASGGTATLVDSEVSDNVATNGGGGVKVNAGGTLDLSQGSTVVGNQARYWGGGVWLDSASLVGGAVQGNAVTDYSYVYLYYGVLYFYDEAFGGSGVAMSGDSDVTGTDVSLNTGATAAVSAALGTGTLVDVSVHDNQGYYGGGAVLVAATLDSQGATEVFDNTGYFGGAGISFAGTYQGGWFHDNVGTGWGGGLILDAGSAIGVVVEGNDGNYFGGGIASLGDSFLTDSTVTGNSAVYGGGIGTQADYGYPGDELVVTNSEITGNTANEGGGAYTAFGLRLVDSSLTDNVASSDGGALRLVVRGAASIDGGSVLRNAAGGRGGAAYLTNDAQLAVTGADFGLDADDNVPTDVRAGFDYDYGANASFTCSTSGCSP